MLYHHDGEEVDEVGLIVEVQPVEVAVVVCQFVKEAYLPSLFELNHFSFVEAATSELIKTDILQVVPMSDLLGLAFVLPTCRICKEALVWFANREYSCCQPLL